LSSTGIVQNQAMRHAIRTLALVVVPLALIAACSSSAAPAPAPSGTIAPGFNEALGSVVNPSEEIGESCASRCRATAAAGCHD
jgi:hypothetical protein